MSIDVLLEYITYLEASNISLSFWFSWFLNMVSEPQDNARYYKSNEFMNFYLFFSHNKRLYNICLGNKFFGDSPLSA